MRRTVAFLVVLTLAAAASPARAFDLSVGSVEVTQAIQTQTNSIELVGGRSVAVRATVVVGGRVPPQPSPVTGRLHVFQNGVAITPPEGLPAMNQPFTPPSAPSRANENDTLNFELPAPTGLGNSPDVDFRVDLDPQPREENTANNSGFANNLVSRIRTFPRIYFARVNWTPSGLGLPPLSYVRPGTGDAFTCGILPVDDSQPDFYRKAPFPSITFTEDGNGDGVLGGSEESELISLLATHRQLLVENGLGANDLTYLYGWIAGNPTSGNGLAQLPGHVAWGNSEPNRGQRTFAHEFTHNLGLDHVNNTLAPEVGWDVGAGLPENPIDNDTAGRVKPESRFDVQVPGQLTPTAWVDPVAYQYLLDHPSFSPANSLLDLRQVARRRLLVIEGRLAPDGGRLIELEPAFRYPWRSQWTPPPESRSQVQVVVKTTDGKTVRANAAALEGDDQEAGQHTQLGHFEAMIPVSGKVASVRILTRGGGGPGARGAQVRRRVVARRRRSRRPPRLRFVTKGGKQLAGNAVVDWRAADPDTRKSRLLFQAAYSPDNGRSFVPIGVELKRSKLTFDTSEVPASAGQGLIRVFASDGLNSTHEDLTGLSVSPDVSVAPTACQDP